MTLLADLTWPEAARLAAAGALLAVPVGSTEQHGPHLPLSTEPDIAVALAMRLAARRPRGGGPPPAPPPRPRGPAGPPAPRPAAGGGGRPASQLRLQRGARRVRGHTVDRPGR